MDLKDISSINLKGYLYMVDVYLSVDEDLKMTLRPQTIIIKILLTNKCMLLEDEIFGFMTASKLQELGRTST